MAAIAGMFWALSLRTFTFAVIGVIQSTVFTVALATFLSPVGLAFFFFFFFFFFLTHSNTTFIYSLPALTFPAAFVCTIWTLINPVLHSSDSFFVTLDHMTIPEDHLRRLRYIYIYIYIYYIFLASKTSLSSIKSMSSWCCFY